MNKSGFVTLAGSPNVGKSTLINRLVGTKVAITSPRPQTTRNRIVGVMSKPDLQVVFVDTPGIMREKSKLNKMMVDAALKSSAESDLLLFMIDASSPNIDAAKYALKRMEKINVPRFLVVNKIDLVKKNDLLGLIQEMIDMATFDEVFPISAKSGDNVDELVKNICDRLPEGPRFYPDDMTTDQPESFLISEIIREKAFVLLQQELPYSTATLVENIEDKPNGVMVISASIFVERKSQKGIVIGKNGAMLKQIGSLARKDLEKRLGAKIFLELHVAVKEKWTGDARSLSNLGYRTD